MLRESVGGPKSKKSKAVISKGPGRQDSKKSVFECWPKVQKREGFWVLTRNSKHHRRNSKVKQLKIQRTMGGLDRRVHSSRNIDFWVFWIVELLRCCFEFRVKAQKPSCFRVLGQCKKTFVFLKLWVKTQKTFAFQFWVKAKKPSPFCMSGSVPFVFGFFWCNFCLLWALLV